MSAFLVFIISFGGFDLVDLNVGGKAISTFMGKGGIAVRDCFSLVR